MVHHARLSVWVDAVEKVEQQQHRSFASILALRIFKDGAATSGGRRMIQTGLGVDSVGIDASSLPRILAITREAGHQTAESWLVES